MGFLGFVFTSTEPVLPKALSQKVDTIHRPGYQLRRAAHPPEGHGPGPLIEDFVFFAQFFFRFFCWSFRFLRRFSLPTFSCLAFQFFLKLLEYPTSSKVFTFKKSSDFKMFKI
jgi:hypothetical protein